MQSVAMCGPAILAAGMCTNAATVALHGVPITFGRVRLPEPAFDPSAAEYRLGVLVEVRAFSCNYRDKSIMLGLHERSRPDSCFCVGSEFVGEVLAVGLEVAELRPGDRVIGDNTWPSAGARGVEAGVATNHASQRHRVIHTAKLCKVPPTMPDEIAAAFGLGAQTAYSLVRRIGAASDMKILVTAARSNTSLFVLNALRPYQAMVCAMTTSQERAAELCGLGVMELIQLDRAAGFGDSRVVRELVARVGRFHAVIDPFYDLHLGAALTLLEPGGVYITCGLYDQHPAMAGQQPAAVALDIHHVFDQAIGKNLQLIGNCLGSRDDLRRALEDYSVGRLGVTLDSVHGGEQIGDFFERTYNVSDRFGKVVYKYDAE